MIYHLKHAAWMWLCNFDGRSRAYFGWVSLGTAWQATAHLKA